MAPFKAIIAVFLVVFVTSIVCQVEEPCKTNAFPPKESDKVEVVTVNLDAAPEKRWAHVVAPKKKELLALIDVIKELVPTKLIGLVDRYLGDILKWLPDAYAREIKGIADATGLPVGEAVLYNIFYELFTVCTSIVGEDKSGKLYHARNLDFGLLLGWDNKNNTWLLTERLRPLIVNVEYQAQGKTIFKAIHFTGYIGILTAVKPAGSDFPLRVLEAVSIKKLDPELYGQKDFVSDKLFTLTMNERFSLDGGYLGVIEWLLGMSKGRWMGFLLRDVMERAQSFSEAKDMLSNTELLAPAYFILGGNKSGEECVITRSRAKTLDTWSVDMSNDRWYVLETNYDRWKKPLFIDDRRTPAHLCMKQLTQAGMSFKGLYNVLSTKPMLNKLTAYTALLQVDSGTLDCYRRYCPDPCWPW